MRVRFQQLPGGDYTATTKLPVNGGSVTLVARVTKAELRALHAARSRRAQQVGFRLSLKSLGRGLKAIAKPATLLKVTAMAGALASGNPALLVAMGPSVVRDIKTGMAATRVLARAADGDAEAQSIVARARAAAAADTRPDARGVHPGVMKYLVTLQRLAS